MANPGLEVLREDKASLARNLRIKVGGKGVLAPTRSLGATRSSLGDLEILSSKESGKTTSFAEVYASLTMDALESFLEDNGRRLEFESAVDRTLSAAQKRDQVPYLLLGVHDNSGDPLNALPPDQELEYLFDLLWRPTNDVVFVPMFGGLRKEKDYEMLLAALKERADTVNSKPIVMTVPSIYRSLTRTVLEKTWKRGIRAFAVDLEGRSMGSQGTVITLVNRVLRGLSKADKEDYLLAGLNVKDHIGTGKYARLHNLLGHAYGFDIIGLNRVRRKGWAGSQQKRQDIRDSIRFLQSGDYGYLNVSEMLRAQRKGQRVELDTEYLQSASLDSLRRMDPEYLRKQAKLHNAVKDEREETIYRQRISSEALGSYLEKKGRIAEDLKLVRRVAAAAKAQTEL